MNLTDIEPLVRDYKTHRATLEGRVAECQIEQQAIIRRKRHGIQLAADRTRDAKAKLEAAIEANPHLFEKPRTQTIEGIRIGFQKGRGKIIVSDKAIELIKRHRPDLEEQLINIKESVNKTALSDLSTSELRKIGCSVIETGDQVLISTPKDNLEKLVDALLEDAEA
jgi:hypothetical protein